MKSSIVLVLLFIAASPAFSKASSGDDPNVCPKTRAAVQASNTAQESDTVSTVPVAATRATPVRTNVRSSAPRTVSPRWHTMLPGMFR